MILIPGKARRPGGRFLGLPEGYDPSVDPGLQAWWTPRVNETFTMVGAKRMVDTWTDRSGNGHVMAPVDGNRVESVEAVAEAYGQPMMRFGGLALLHCATLVVAPPFAIYMVASKTNGNTNAFCGAPNLTGIIQYRSGSTWRAFITGSPSTYMDTSATYLGVRALCLVVADQESSLTVSGAFDDPEATNAVAAGGTTDGFCLGDYRTNGSRIQGDIGEIVVTSTLPERV